MDLSILLITLGIIVIAMVPIMIIHHNQKKRNKEE